MISVLALKHDHTLYKILRELVKDLNYDFNIIGLDNPIAGNYDAFYLNSELYSKPFFFYLEEPNCFRNSEILKNKNFLGFISHLKTTCNEMKNNFGVEVNYLELSSKEKNYSKIVENINSLRTNRPIRFVSWGSWVDHGDNNFFNRGGSESDRLLSELFEHIDGQLIFRTNKYLNCKSKFPDRVELISRYIDESEMENFCYGADVFLLPAKQVHSVSLTYAMSFGLMLVVSDGWGFEEYCDDSNSVNYREINKILNICLNREELIKRRLNSLEKFKSKYTPSKHFDRFASIINVFNNRILA